MSADTGVLVALPDDLLALKVAVVIERSEAKDYRVTVAMLRAGVDLHRPSRRNACSAARDSILRSA